MSDNATVDVLGLTAQIVVAHVSHNQVAPASLPSLIEGVYQSLATAGQPAPEPAAPPTPAVPVKRSVFPDFIVCLEDGKKLKVLTRHLRVAFGMTPEQYRAKWRLPASYPMVAPNYAASRSVISKKTQSTRTPVAEPEVVKLPARRAKGLRKSI
jgi:predicted transcriptional regulator